MTDLAGLRYSRRGSIKRWGSNPGLVFLGNQKLSIRVPRLRDVEENEEVELESYHQLQSPQIVDERVFAQVLNGISTRKYEKAVEKIPQTYGISKSSVYRKFIHVSAKLLRQLHERNLSDQEIIAYV